MNLVIALPSILPSNPSGRRGLTADGNELPAEGPIDEDAETAEVTPTPYCKLATFTLSACNSVDNVEIYYCKVSHSAFKTGFWSSIS